MPAMTGMTKAYRRTIRHARLSLSLAHRPNPPILQVSPKGLWIRARIPERTAVVSTGVASLA